MAGEHDEHDPRFTAVYRGVVMANDDPKKIGRVRFRVPGLIDPQSAWAHPFTIGGGSAARGIYFVPDVGSEVACFFHQGDVDHPHYIAGVWNAPGGSSSLNSRITSKSPDQAPKVKVIETERWLIVMDDSIDTPGFLITDKLSAGLDAIEFNGLTRALSVKATASITIQSIGQIQIQGLNVTINGRPVLPAGGPI